jgi:pimeloyl-ACP methyl ester carboxylesterase
MSIQRQLRVACLLLLAGVILPAAAREVTLDYRGLTLNADLELAAGRQLADGVILVTHGGLAHRDMESLIYLRGLLKERGYSTLAINLSLGLNNRHGMYDCKITHRHRNADAADEIGAWLAWLQDQGAKHVTLLGHSRGGAQTALYAAGHRHALVQKVVLLAPATRANSDAAGYQERFHKPLAPILSQARQRVKDGKGDSVLEHVDLLNCSDTSATAHSFVSYYGPDPRLDAIALIPKITQPLLVLVAGNDEVVVDLEKKLAALVDGKRVHMQVVEHSDHFFRDLYTDDAVDAIDAFLRDGNP